MKRLLFLSAVLLLMAVALPTRAATLESITGDSVHNENHTIDDGHKGDDTTAHLSKPEVTDTDHPNTMGLKRVEPKQVCMVNNKFMGTEQISITVDGKTYYGCCPMCKERLKNDTQARIGTDPISGNPIDKASAIIGASPDGTIYYFENEKNMQRFGNDPSRYIQPTDVEP